MMFASRAAREVTNCGSCGRAFIDGEPDPRCTKWIHEWDRGAHVQHHEPNRILLELRNNRRDIFDLLLDLDSLWASQFPSAEVAHARSVLDRLSTFGIKRRTEPSRASRVRGQ